MSYILDALKKSHAEQADAGVSLRMDQSTSRHRLAPWLAGLVAVLLVNISILLWIFVIDVDDAATPAPASAAEVAQPAPASAIEQPRSPVPKATVSTPSAPARADTPTAAPRTAPRRPPAPAAPPAQRVALRELPAIEQTLYNGFIYSTHIYTDDPALCAIVVDGQRLTAGDSFKGLRVVAVTEGGVVFSETRRGVTREVEVSVLDQWEN
jgi:hypothetical protein